jgi:hypothetical protein
MKSPWTSAARPNRNSKKKKHETKPRNPPLITESKENLNWNNIHLHYPTIDSAVYGRNGTLQEKLRKLSKKNQSDFTGLAYHASDPYQQYFRNIMSDRARQIHSTAHFIFTCLTQRYFFISKLTALNSNTLRERLYHVQIFVTVSVKLLYFSHKISQIIKEYKE